MRRVRGWRSLAALLALVQFAFNLLLFAVHPAWGSIVLALVWLATGGFFTGSAIIHRHHEWSARQQHSIFFSVPGGPVKAGRTVVLEPGEQLLPEGWKRLETRRDTRYVQECSHWPRDDVKLNDGTTVAYICRRCDHDWVDENYVSKGVDR